MGIKGLFKFINEIPNLNNNVDNTTYKYKKIAIDISLLLYKICISKRNFGSDYLNSKGESISHILILFNKTIELLNNKIIPVYIFDGKPPEIKKKTIEMRRLTKKKAMEKLKNATNEDERIKYFKRCFKITKQQWDECKELLTLMGVPFINAPEEADSQCAYLSKLGLVDGVFTEDMDILTFGSKKIIKNLTSYKYDTSEILLDDVLKKLDLNQEEFIDFCILLGSDYCNGIVDVNPLTIFEYYYKNKTIEKTLEMMRLDNYNVPNSINYQETKNYFLNPNVVNVDNTMIMLKCPNYKLLYNILINKYSLVKYIMKRKLSCLMSNYENLKEL